MASRPFSAQHFEKHDHFADCRQATPKPRYRENAIFGFGRSRGEGAAGYEAHRMLLSRRCVPHLEALSRLHPGEILTPLESSHA